MIKASILTKGTDHAELQRLVQLLHDHPEVELVAYADPENTGMTLDELYPALTGETSLSVVNALDATNVDVVFIVGDSDVFGTFASNPTIHDDLFVIDMTHGASSDFVQGIPELNRKAMVRGAHRVAMPDAVTTAVAISLLPMAKNLLLNNPVSTYLVLNDTKADADSLTAATLSDKTAEQVAAALKSLQNSFNSTVDGVVAKGDVPEGLIAVTTINTPVDIDELKKLYTDFYDDHNFTFIVDSRPDVSDVRDTNKAFIHLDKQADKLVITTVLDTDLKGGAGNAVHAMNLLFGLIEKVGL